MYGYLDLHSYLGWILDMLDHDLGKKMCMDMFVLLLSHLVKHIYLFQVKDLWTRDTCIVCYLVYLSCFKCIRNVYDRVKFLYDVMFFFCFSLGL